MGRRNEHSYEQIRELALTAATQIVTEQGLAGLSARKVAAAIGYTVGSLYLVFANLDDLILRVNERTLDELHQCVVSVIRDNQQLDKYLSALVQVYLQFAMQQPHRWRMIFEHSMANEKPVPAWYQTKVLGLFGLIEHSLQKLMPIQHSHHCAQLARILWGSVHGICILALTGKLDVVGTNSVQDLLEGLVKMFLLGLQNAE